MAAVIPMLPGTEQALYTCLSCSIAFFSAEDQRVHYKSDHHRYNMKRRVANLPPVSAQAFDQKVLERRAETAVMASPKGATCQACSKSFATENSYQSHIASRKHKENEMKAALKPSQVQSEDATMQLAEATSGDSQEPTKESTQETPKPQEKPKEKIVSLTVPEDATEEEIEATIEAKIAAARSKLSPNSCLFCSHTSDSIDANLEHMSLGHSFFVPDAEYLVDLPGLITYLGEKIAVGNVCIACPSREFRSIEAVRKHMIDKGHCKIAYDRESQRLEVSEFYDFSSSYPDAEARLKRKRERAARRAAREEAEQQEGWEDVDGDEGGDDMDVDEIVDESASESDSDGSILDDNGLSFGDTPYELVLPSGARIGHRSLRRYYAQAPSRAVIAPRPGSVDDENSGAALVRRLIADKNSALVPTKGGFGAYGSGTEVVKARNRGEAREAGRHIREFRDQNRREQFKTKIGYIREPAREDNTVVPGTTKEWAEANEGEDEV
ncbi:C2H2 type zinc-finger protein [Ceratobasidium theobromae]|uniref:C2H2 type zinc-finger protein n=1 Tax=Ceratobasidium theobromae TaxID=1582974 RepID=A0A5N5QU20_9AGAM|nr:C2H2 type zinc-finger protein [Ceratobasidium theobromae]